MSSEGAVITLQAGLRAQWVGGHLWSLREEAGEDLQDIHFHSTNDGTRLPRAVLLAYAPPNAWAEAELGLEHATSAMQQLEEEAKFSGVTFIRQRTVNLPTYHWSRIFKGNYHSRSLVRLDGTSAGSSNSTDGALQWMLSEGAAASGCRAGDLGALKQAAEDAADAVRYFAESADRLSTVEILASSPTLGSDDPSPAVLSLLLPILRDDLGPNVSVPIWYMNHNSPYGVGTRHDLRTTNGATTGMFQLPPDQSLLAPKQSSLIAECADLHMLQALSEWADVIINVSGCQSIQAARFAGEKQPLDEYAGSALAMHTATSYRYPQDDSSNDRSTKHWVHGATRGNNVPYVGLEAYIEGITGETLTWERMERSLELIRRQKAHSSGVQSAQVDVNTLGAQDFSLANPFLISFSNLRKRAVAEYKGPTDYTRPFSNSISFMGYTDQDLVQKIFTECISSNYFLNNCNTTSHPVKLPAYHAAVPASWYDEDVMNVQSYDNREVPTSYPLQATAAVSASGAIVDDLIVRSESWIKHSRTIKSQLQKIGLGVDEISAITNSLLEMSERYSME